MTKCYRRVPVHNTWVYFLTINSAEQITSAKLEKTNKRLGLKKRLVSRSNVREHTGRIERHLC